MTGAALTIAAFTSALGEVGGILVCIGISLFAFSTILGWEYHGEKAFEYLVKKPKYCFIYRIVFSLVAYVGATTTLQIVWDFSDIANGLMAIPNLICLIAMSGVVAREMKAYQKVIEKEKRWQKTGGPSEKDGTLRLKACREKVVKFIKNGFHNLLCLCYNKGYEL